MGNTLPLPMVAMASSTYVATSLYLLLNPLARFKSSPKMKQIPLIAHRGGAGEGYENTILAFRRAVDHGAGMLELDVHLSKDGETEDNNLRVLFHILGEVVVAHDLQLNRLAGVQQSIRDLNFHQLPCIQQTVSIDFCPGQKYSDSSVREEERNFSTLDTVLREFPSTQINIDLKDRDDVLVEKVNQIIVENNAEGSLTEYFCSFPHNDFDFKFQTDVFGEISVQQQQNCVT